jgi:polysaccharide transporter, PST family
MTPRKKLKNNLILIYLVYFSRASVYLLLLPLLIRRLDEGWAQVAVVLSFIQLSVTAIEFGFGVSSTRSVSKNMGSIVFLKKILYSVLSLQCVLFIGVALVSIPLIYFSVIQNISHFILVLLVIFFQGITPIWFLKGIEDLKLVTISEVVSKVIVLILVYFLVKDSNDIGVVYLSYLVGAIIPVATSYVYIYNRYIIGVKSSLTFSTILSQAQEGFLFFGVRLSGMFVGVGGSLVLGATGHIKLAGTFAIVERILSGVRNILMPAWDVLFPRLVSLISKNNDMAEIFKKRSTIIMVFFSLLVSMSLFIFSSTIVQYFTNREDEAIKSILQTMAIVPLLVSVINSFGLSYLVSHGRDRLFLFSIFSGAFLYIIFLGFFISEDLELLAYAYNVSLALSMILVIFFTSRNYVQKK